MATNSQSGRFDILISGASFSGMALARALSLAAKGGLRIGLIDRAASPATRPDARAFALSAASCRMLKALGVWSAIASEAEPVLDIEITDSSLEDGIRPVLMTYSNRLPDGEPASYIVPASPLLLALHHLTANDPGIIRAATADALSTTAGPHSVSVHLSAGDDLTATVVVAAEGRQSALREAAGIKLTGWGYGQTGIVTTIAHERPHHGCAVQHFLPAGPFAILPLPGNRSCITWSEETAEAQRIMALDDAAFLAEVDKRFGGRLGGISLAGPRQSWPLSLHLARTYVGSRLALLGDTAHGVHPIAGQGLNLGLRDAAALAEVIADAARLGLDIGSPAVLERYERWRRFDSTISAAAFDGLNRTFSMESTLARAVRGFGLSVVDRLPGLKEMFVAEAAGVTGELPRLLQGEAI